MVTQMTSSLHGVLCWKQFNSNCQVGMWSEGPDSPCSQGLSPMKLWGSLFSSVRTGGQDQPLRIIVRAATSQAALFSYLRHLYLLGAPACLYQAH